MTRQRPILLAGGIVLAAMMTGCGSAPAIQSPDRALAPAMPAAPCNSNQPPPGYGGPISPHVTPCPAPWIGSPVIAPGRHDYSQGQPPRTVR